MASAVAYHLRCWYRTTHILPAPVPPKFPPPLPPPHYLHSRAHFLLPPLSSSSSSYPVLLRYKSTLDVPRPMDPPTAYEEALSCLSSLITRRTRADGSNKGDHFDLMFDYIKILDLEESISKLKVIHVAGTKGKGSTCTFTESILRNCGFRTGLFTSPHLIDVRERFRLDGVEVSEDKFLEYFWWCWNRLQEKTNDDVPMPTYFRFLALLAFKIFAQEQVDVAILEVGLGGKFDATNVVQAPIVCGISSLGYDHMEILGHTLRQIAGEKAGIFKQGVPAYTVPQPEEAMSALKDRASHIGVSLQVASPLGKELLKSQQLGLHGEHQYLNAGLAVALSSTWLQRTGHIENLLSNSSSSLPEQFARGLTMANLQGRAQIIPDPHISMQDPNSSVGGLVFYLDGAHSPESLEVCARWFSHVSREETEVCDPLEGGSHDICKSTKILLFNCMSVRDPQLLLPPLVNTCAHLGIHFNKALFVPNQSVYNKVGSHSTAEVNQQEIDLSWQLTLQRVWENLIHKDKGLGNKTIDSHEGNKDGEPSSASSYESSSVFPSLPLAIKWLRENAQQNRSIRFQVYGKKRTPYVGVMLYTFQDRALAGAPWHADTFLVLVTGSLHLVGDVLKLIKR